MNMLSNHALREIPPGRAATPWTLPWRGDTNGMRETFRAEVSAADRILRQTRQVALGRHRSTRMHAHAARCAYLIFHRSSVRLRMSPGREEVVTPLHVSLHAAGDIHAREALNDEGHDFDWIAIAPEFLRSLRAGFPDTGDDAHDGDPPSLRACEATPEIFLARHRLFTAASRSEH